MKPLPATGPASLHSGGGREIPTLHGLRAVSIGLVLLSHAALMPQVPHLGRFTKYGELGVLVFFVISGYLITTLLSTELDQTGAVSLRRFYLRRTLRIVPAYAAYLLGAALLAAFVQLAPANARWWPALTYTSNLFPTKMWLIGHSWSLSVEEQFYLSWPIAFVIAGRRRALWIALAALVASPLVRVALYAITHDKYVATTWNHDFIAAGCALSLIAPHVRGWLWQAVLRWGWLAGIVAMALYGLTFGDDPWAFALRISIGETLLAVLLATAIIWCVTNASSPLGRFLDSTPLRAIGILSYSLYLWQQPFLGQRPIVPAPWAFVCIAIAAGASYYIVERPALYLKRRFERYMEIRVPRAECRPVDAIGSIAVQAVVES